jgi:hypothetical protein
MASEVEALIAQVATAAFTANVLESLAECMPDCTEAATMRDAAALLAKVPALCAALLAQMRRAEAAERDARTAEAWDDTRARLAAEERATAAEAARAALVERHGQAERELHQAVARQKARAEAAEVEAQRLREERDAAYTVAGHYKAEIERLREEVAALRALLVLDADTAARIEAAALTTVAGEEGRDGR